MKQPLDRGIDYVLEDPTVLDIALGLLLLLICAACIRGVLAVRRGGESPGTRSWIRLPGSLGLLAVLLAVAGLALRTVVGFGRLQELGQNITPTDFFYAYADGYLVLAAGVLVGTVGLVATWILEWIHETRSA